MNANTILHFGPAGGDPASGGDNRALHRRQPAPPILLTPISTKTECQRKRPWQRSGVTRRGLPAQTRSPARSIRCRQKASIRWSMHRIVTFPKYHNILARWLMITPYANGIYSDSQGF
ncbi:hypothetical protein F5883DRAFT_30685 [Diaporthe sp. PMI_573]|nr:hypothetical protein F5883DRAFT_30685 [Diaporthaceae sp. PMI_573]